MSRSPWPSTYDRDLDERPRVARPPAEPIDPYRRLVANPLLGVVGGLTAVYFLRVSLEHRVLSVFLAALGLLFGAFFLVQFHCLDCGATGWLLRAGRHACPPLVDRWREGRMGRWRFPGLKAQVLIWLHVLASIGGLIVILFVLSR